MPAIWLLVSALTTLPLTVTSGCHTHGQGSQRELPSLPVVFPGLGVRVAVETIAPIVPVRAEGSFHLLYELRLTNFENRLFELESLGVFDGEPGDAPLASYTSDQLRAMILSLAYPRSNRLHLAPGSHATLFLWVQLDPGRPNPGTLTHRLVLRGDSGAGASRLELQTTPIELSTDAPLIIDAPLKGGPWFAHAGPAEETHHRRTLAPRNGKLTMGQRFATDWVRLKETSDEYGPPAYAPDWADTTGQLVHAVADGVVVNAVSDLPDDPDLDPDHATPQAETYRNWISQPNAITWDTIGGNLVTVRMDNGGYAWYEHLQQGSVRVNVGDRVSRGQILGLVGSSGNAGAPHLHFEITDSATKGLGNGLPYVFRSFELRSRVTPLPTWNQLVRFTPERLGMTQAALMQSAPAVHTRIGEIPLGGAVVQFSTTPSDR